MKLRIVLNILLFLLIFGVTGVFAQEDPVSPGQSIDNWLLATAGLWAAAQAIIELVVRTVFGEDQVDSGNVAKILQGIAIAVFVVAGLFNATDQLAEGASTVEALLDPLLSILLVIFGPDVVRPEDERKVLGRSQGVKPLRLEKSKHDYS